MPGTHASALSTALYKAIHLMTSTGPQHAGPHKSVSL